MCGRPGPPTATSGGGTLEQVGNAFGQRVWKGQPGGGSTGEGTSPASTMRRDFRCGSGTGTADSSASV